MSRTISHRQAEALRTDDRHWWLGVIYICADDPRVIVRNRYIFGWTWNFARPGTVPAILVAVLLALGLPALVSTAAAGPWPVLAAFAAAVVLLCLIASRIAGGPR